VVVVSGVMVSDPTVLDGTVVFTPITGPVSSLVPATAATADSTSARTAMAPTTRSPRREAGGFDCAFMISARSVGTGYAAVSTRLLSGR
jgi:hypothetical protein